ncbi:MAG: hypothetical protein IJZ61_01215 [Oscillospiraceae bacterium]|nr:hypothetical protein [Oscillospiraceae bacterium]
MLISEYLQLRNVSVTTGKAQGLPQIQPSGSQTVTPQNSDFAKELKNQLEALNQSSGVQFSKHAMERINERNIDLSEDNNLCRINKSV